MNYIRLAILVAIACLIGGLSFELWQARSSEKQAIANAAAYKVQVDDMLKLNASQAKTIAGMIDQRAIDDAAVAGINDKLTAIQAQSEVTAAQLETLQNDPTSKAFVDTVLPAGVGVLFTK